MVATVGVGRGPDGVAVTPDGKHAYVVNDGSNTVSVIDTATNPVVRPRSRWGIRPRGRRHPGRETRLRRELGAPDNVSVIDTASNKVVATVEVGNGPDGVAVTPDGKHVYVAIENLSSTRVSVIDTATNTVVATVAVGHNPFGVGIVPPPPGVPFLAFNANLDIAFGTSPNTDAFTLGTSFTLSSTAPAINPVTQPVTLQAGTFAVTIPPGSFFENRERDFQLRGGDQWRDPEGADQVHGHIALRVPGRSAGREFYRDHELRVCHPGNWRRQLQQQRQRRNLGHRHDFPSPLSHSFSDESRSSSPCSK